VSPARLYIIDEHDTVRSALADRLDQAANLTVVGRAGDAELVMRDIRSDKPDVVLVEVKRSDGLGLEIVRQIAARRAGANSYLLKDIDSEELIRRISELAAS
jgi:two-component system response regulator DevR